MLILLAMLAGFIFIQTNPGPQRQIANLLWGGDNSEEDQAAPTARDEQGGDTVSLGQNEQAERKRRDDEKDRNKKRAEEAARAALEEERERETADEKRMSLERKQKEAAERAVKQQALSDKLKKQEIAYEAIMNHAAITLQDLPIAVQIGGGPLKQAVICRLDPDNLLGLSFDLAVPSNPLSDAEPFEATVQPAAEQRLSWQISATPTRTIDNDSNVKPIPLATISVTDGQLVLKPARNDILGNQLFSQLRQSVLLVKARNPEQPDTAAGVVKAIQLVRPVSLTSFTVGVFDKPTARKLSLPPLGDSQRGNDKISPNFPASATVQYEITCDFGPDGTDHQTAHGCSWSPGVSDSFVPLLECPPAPRVPLNPPTAVGRRVTFAAGLSQVILTPDVDGPGEKAFDLDKIRVDLRDSDEVFQKLVITQERQLANTVGAFCGPVDGVNGGDLNRFMKRYEADFIDYFQPQAYEDWIKQCKLIQLQAATLPRPVAPPPGAGGAALGLSLIAQAAFDKDIRPFREQWQLVFVPRIKDWFADYAIRLRQQRTQRRRHFLCLQLPPLVTVKSVTITTTDKDGNKHPVILARTEPQESTQKEAPPVAEASDSQPKL